MNPACAPCTVQNLPAFDVVLMLALWALIVMATVLTFGALYSGLRELYRVVRG